MILERPDIPRTCSLSKESQPAFSSLSPENFLSANSGAHLLFICGYLQVTPAVAHCEHIGLLENQMEDRKQFVKTHILRSHCQAVSYCQLIMLTSSLHLGLLVATRLARNGMESTIIFLG